jgi:hypothetical protein
LLQVLDANTLILKSQAGVVGHLPTGRVSKGRIGMAESKQEIINAFEEYIQKGGGGYKSWYVGISSNARDRLFNQHKVREEGDWWIYKTATSSQVAREIESYFVGIRGTDGGLGGGDENADMVYAYRKAAHTNP